MKVLCFIDSLNTGGAQKQIVAIACGFKKRAIDVAVVTIHPIYTYRQELDKLNIPIICLESSINLVRLIKFITLVKQNKPNLIISYLNAPNTIATLSKILMPLQNFKIIVSERKGFEKALSFMESLRLYLHFFAHKVVVNSFRAQDFLTKNNKILSKKIKVIYNISPVKSLIKKNILDKQLNIVVIANYRVEKNMSLVILAAKQLANLGFNFKINWYGENFFKHGKPTKQSTPFLLANDLIAQNMLESFVTLNTFYDNTSELYENSDAILLASSFEGLPNVVCEAMGCGSIILSSDVSDLKNWIKHKETGYIFSELSTNEIAESIKWLATVSEEQKKKIALKNYNLANELFAESAVINSYLKCLG